MVFSGANDDTRVDFFVFSKNAWQIVHRTDQIVHTLNAIWLLIGLRMFLFAIIRILHVKMYYFNYVLRTLVENWKLTEKAIEIDWRCQKLCSTEEWNIILLLLIFFLLLFCCNFMYMRITYGMGGRASGALAGRSLGEQRCLGTNLKRIELCLWFYWFSILLLWLMLELTYVLQGGMGVI